MGAESSSVRESDRVVEDRSELTCARVYVGNRLG